MIQILFEKIKKKLFSKEEQIIGVHQNKKPFKIFLTQTIKDELLRVKKNENYNSAEDYLHNIVEPV